MHEPVGKTQLQIRPGRPEDGERLRGIALAAKSYWGYDQKVVSDWAAALDFTPTSFGRRELFVTVIDGEIVAWVALVKQGTTCILDDLWVDPKWIRRGVGTQLFDHALAQARLLGAERLEWGADPNATGFYERMGGRRLRNHTTEWGRQVPWMGVDLQRRPARAVVSRREWLG